MWVAEVLRFWFEELTPQDWFTKSDALDDRIRERFAKLHELMRNGEIAIPDTPSAYLAAVIVLDQFSRNVSRGTPGAFACDARALALSQEAIARGYDRDFSKPQRQFLYMPFMHSEDRAVQARSVELFATLGDAYIQKFADEHREIVERFGRYPHRNSILQRASTAEEVEFLQTHAGF
jgi:uncharacterized protein (DUF924 family)